jgi:hypothetical protein
VVNVWAVIVLVCVFIFIFTVIDTNVDGVGKDGNIEDFEEDHGQANQGKPSKLVASLNPSFTYCIFYQAL